MMTKRVDPRPEREDAKVFYIDAYGSSEGGRLEVQSTQGALDFLDLALEPESGGPGWRRL